jgi:hypothetical protein
LLIMAEEFPNSRFLGYDISRYALARAELSSAKAEAMARAAGFTRFRQIDVEHPINAFYEIRP